jgi:hypothetical protein
MEKEKEKKAEQNRLLAIAIARKFDADRKVDKLDKAIFDNIKSAVQQSDITCIATLNVNRLLSAERFDLFQQWVNQIGRPTVVVAVHVEVWRPDPDFILLDGYHFPIQHLRWGRLGGGILVYLCHIFGDGNN